MKIGYGYNRRPEALTDLGARRVFIDTPKTGRSERAEMLGPLGARKGDTLVMLAASDLGRGREVQKVKDAVASLGVKIVTPDKPTKYNKPGRPRKLVPTPAQDRKIRALYRSFLTMGHVLNRASEIMGYDVKRHQLLYRYGNRWPDQ